jgi:hypothetical protein
MAADGNHCGDASEPSPHKNRKKKRRNNLLQTNQQTQSLDQQWQQLLCAFACNQPAEFAQVLSDPDCEILKEICRAYKINIDLDIALTEVGVHFCRKWTHLQKRLSGVEHPIRPFIRRVMRNAILSYRRWVWRFQRRHCPLAITDEDGSSKSDYPVISKEAGVMERLANNELLRILRSIELPLRQMRYTVVFKLRCLANCAPEDIELFLLTPRERMWVPLDPDNPRLIPAIVVERRILRRRLRGRLADFSSAWLAHAFGLCLKSDSEERIKLKANLVDQWYHRAEKAYGHALRLLLRRE